MLIKDIVIIGSGNLATNLAFEFIKSKKNVKCIYSRTENNAKILADQCNCAYTDKLDELPKSADLYIIAVKDSAIEEIAGKLGGLSGIIVHTSGSTPMSVFPDSIKNCGVFYPLMTFSKADQLLFRDIPICIEANLSGKNIDLMRFAKSISKNVYNISSDKRMMLHLAAVFACNFTTFNYTVAEELLQKNDLSFNLLKPLILQTAKNIMIGKPAEHQTGPAVREDEIVMRKQVKILSDMPEYKEMYQLLSKLIISTKHKK